jgi:hypothetical protein
MDTQYNVGKKDGTQTDTISQDIHLTDYAIGMNKPLLERVRCGYAGYQHFLLSLFE